MISGEIRIRPRYGEVDRMGYVYHANYVDYCHQARTELLRDIGIGDSELEEHNIMLPVISMNLKYLKPAYYDQTLIVRSFINEMPVLRLSFDFEIVDDKCQKICVAQTTVVFVDARTRKPLRTPDIVKRALEPYFQPELS